MKRDTTLQKVAARYNCTLLRACSEILAAAGEEKRHLPAVIRRQKIPANLVGQAKAYRARKIGQISGGRGGKREGAQGEAMTMNETRKTRKQLREMADERGFICGKGRKTPTLHISEDGTITRADTDLSLCRAMTVTEAFKSLGK